MLVTVLRCSTTATSGPTWLSWLPSAVAIFSAAVAAGVALWIQFNARRHDRRGAARMWRDDFYAMQLELDIVRNTGKWSGGGGSTFPVLGTVDTLRTVAAATQSHRHWVSIAHANRSLQLTLEKRSRGEHWSASQRDDVEEILDSGREALAQLEWGRSSTQQWKYVAYVRDPAVTAYPLGYRRYLQQGEQPGSKETRT